MKLKELKKGGWFTKKEIEYPKESQVWIKADYIPGKKSYIIIRWSDLNDIMIMKEDTEVYTDFQF